MEGTTNSQSTTMDKNYQEYNESDTSQQAGRQMEEGTRENVENNESISVKMMSSMGSDLLILCITSTMVFLQAATSCVNSNSCSYQITEQDKNLISYGEFIEN